MGRTFRAFAASLASGALLVMATANSATPAQAATDDWVAEIQSLPDLGGSIAELLLTDELVVAVTESEVVVWLHDGQESGRYPRTGPVAVWHQRVLVGSTVYGPGLPVAGFVIDFGCEADTVALGYLVYGAVCDDTVRVRGRYEETIPVDAGVEWELHVSENSLVATSSLRTIFVLDGVRHDGPGSVPADGMARAVPWSSGAMIRRPDGWTRFAGDHLDPTPVEREAIPDSAASGLLLVNVGGFAVVVDDPDATDRVMRRTAGFVDPTTTAVLRAPGDSAARSPLVSTRGDRPTDTLAAIRHDDTGDVVELWHLVDLATSDCTIVGTGLDDTIDGTPGDDVICALGGDDLIRSGLGDDVVRASFGDDTVFGGPDADEIHGGGGFDLLFGGEGDDYLSPAGGVAWGLDGNDSLAGQSGDVLGGGEGNDLLQGDEVTAYGGPGDDTFSVIRSIVYGGPGDDSQSPDYGGDNSIAYLGPGNDSFGPCNVCTAHGGPGNDVLHAVDFAFGGEGDDHIYDADANVRYTNLAVGGPGNDHISLPGGGTGYGGEGDDLLTTPRAGGNTYFGGPGNDTLTGGEGNDRLWGGPGTDTIDGADGEDDCWANGGSTINCEPDSST